ncbi:MAG: energy transducer TonB [Bacteroidota bacterium]
MQFVGVLTIFLCLVAGKLTAQHDQYFISNSFQNYAKKKTAYKRTYGVGDADTLETKDYVKNRLVIHARFAQDYGKDITDGFLKFYRSKLRQPDLVKKYEAVKARITHLSKDTITSELQFVNGKEYYLKVFDDQRRQVLDDSGNGLLQEERKNGDTYFELYQDSLLRYSYRLEENGDTIHYHVDEIAEPIAGYRQFYEELVPKIKYPLTQLELGREATFYIQFVVNEDGRLGNFKCLNNNVPEFEKKVMKQLSKLKQWRPAILEGRSVKSGYTLPVSFRLTD